MAKRHRYACIAILFIFILYREFYTSKDNYEIVIGDERVSRGGYSSVFSTLTQNKIASVEIDPSFRDTCFIRDGVLACRFDKMCNTNKVNCYQLLGSIISNHNPKEVRLAIGELDFASAGNIIDSFLSSHSTWEIIEEPYTHAPLKEIKLQGSSSTPNIQATLFSTLDKLQFPVECSKLWSEVFEATETLPTIVSSISHGMSVSLETAKTYVSLFRTDNPWKLAKSCGRPIWSCFFLSFTNCTSSLSHIKTNSDRKNILSPNSVPEPFKTLLLNTGITNPLLWWRIHLMKYLMRPNYNTRMVINREITEIKLDGPCVTMYLRSYDKVENNINLVKSFLEMIEGNTVLLILENEEDIKKIESFNEESKFKIKYVNLTRKIYKEEIYWYLTVMKLVGQCSAFVGSFSSDFASFVYQSMCLSNDACPLHSAVDGSEWNVG